MRAPNSYESACQRWSGDERPDHKNLRIAMQLAARSSWAMAQMIETSPESFCAMSEDAVKGYAFSMAGIADDLLAMAQGPDGEFA